MEIPEAIEQIIARLEHDHEHGAHHFAEQALRIMADAAEKHAGDNSGEMLGTMWRVGKRLIEIRPSMSASIIHAVTGLWDAVMDEFRGNKAIGLLKRRVSETKLRLFQELESAIRDVSERAAGIISRGDTVLLHSYSSSIIETIRKAASKRPGLIVTESRPLCEGVRTAGECSKFGVDTTLITDAQAGIFIEKCDLVLVGADALLPSGAVVNKAGTSLIAAAAAQNGVPLHVVAHSWKLHPDDMDGLEEKDPSEVIDGPRPFRVMNVYFDITPPENITSIITENGQVTPSEVQSLVGPIRKSYDAFLSGPLSA